MTTPKRPSTNASRPLRGKSSCVCWPTSPTPISSSTVGMSADMPPRRRLQTDPSRAKNRPANEPQGGSVTGTRAIRRALISVYRSEEHTSELQSRFDLVCRLLLEKKKNTNNEEFKHVRTSAEHIG